MKVKENRYFLILYVYPARIYYPICFHIMWAWDYTPSAHGRAKPITAAQLRRMREDYARAENLSKEVLEVEKKEQEELKSKMNNLLEDIF